MQGTELSIFGVNLDSLVGQQKIGLGAILDTDNGDMVVTLVANGTDGLSSIYCVANKEHGMVEEAFPEFDALSYVVDDPTELIHRPPAYLVAHGQPPTDCR